MSGDLDPSAWLFASVNSLGAVGSWTGRIHVHKLLATVQLLELAEVPLDFSLYRYGPYSRELDSLFVQEEAAGRLDLEYPKPNYGPQFSVPEDVEPGLSQKSEEVVQDVAQEFGKKSSKELELIVTCLWVERQEHLHDDDRIVQRVRNLKPRYEEPEIRERLTEARDLATKLTP